MQPTALISDKASRLVRATLARLRPPPEIPLAEWIEAHVRLPEGLSAMPGRMKLWPYQVEIANAIGDPHVERVVLVKAARIGFTSLLTAALANWTSNDPQAVLVLLPVESDCRDYVTSDLEPLFAASGLAGILTEERIGQRGASRNTILSRKFPGGSLKIVAAQAPRNLRRHTAKILLIDEADAMEASAEGNPLALAEKRTLTFADRKIIVGSTPLLEDTSHVLRAYAASDKRVRDGTCYVLAHVVAHGPTVDDRIWTDLDDVLEQRWPHPLGGTIGVDAAAVDAGDGGAYDRVLKFCTPRWNRRVFATKGAAGFARPAFKQSAALKGRLSQRLYIIGVDSIKSVLFAKLQRGQMIRFSNALGPEYFEQLASERRVIKYMRGRPEPRFERIPGRRAETLDCLVMCIAAREGCAIALDAREQALRLKPASAPRPNIIRSKWLDGV